VQDGEVKPFPLGISVATGALGAGKGFVFNVGLNGAGGAANAWIDNEFYGSNENIWSSAKDSSVAAAIGYGIGYGAEYGYNWRMSRDINAKINRPDFIMIGPATYAPTGPYAAAYILSNISSATSQELWSIYSGRAESDDGKNKDEK
jgi:hypothetical protein